MGTTQPIRDKNELFAFRSYYREVKPHARNYALIVLGLNTALRISDMLNLKWKDVYDFRKKDVRSHLLLVESKTGKSNAVALNAHVREALLALFRESFPEKEAFIFSKHTHPEHHLNRTQAYNIIKEAASHTVSERAISCHSLRKTFGYHAWKQGIPPILLMHVFNHSSYQITKRYLGIEQDEKDALYLNIML